MIGEPVMKVMMLMMLRPQLFNLAHQLLGRSPCQAESFDSDGHLFGVAHTPLSFMYRGPLQMFQYHRPPSIATRRSIRVRQGLQRIRRLANAVGDGIGFALPVGSSALDRVTRLLTVLSPKA